MHSNEINRGKGSLPTKCFLLQFYNGKELWARIPRPVAGNLLLTMASKAKARLLRMEYVRLRYPSRSSEVPPGPFPKIPRGSRLACYGLLYSLYLIIEVRKMRRILNCSTLEHYHVTHFPQKEWIVGAVKPCLFTHTLVLPSM